MRCNECGSRSQKRDYLKASKSGGGTYRRGGRSYRSTICRDCAESLLRWSMERNEYDHDAGHGRWSYTSLAFAVGGELKDVWMAARNDYWERKEREHQEWLIKWESGEYERH